ncbi:MAG: hypothetical protein COB36_14555 [Alphaproteobacteria bacterium]|nr:MAG: hypothetical protein COB36_14555 [Alphaproteobacteria bacterium]
MDNHLTIFVLGTKPVKRKLRNLPFLFLFLFGFFVANQVSAGPTNWTEEKIGKVAVKADKAATRKNWRRAIKYGEQMLAGSTNLYGSEAPNTITRLKTLNRYYDHAGRLGKIPERVKRAHLLSKQHFKPNHDTAVISRLLYYKLLIAQKQYVEAIRLVHENIALLTDSEEDQFKKLQYLEQLHGLYALNRQLPERETILLDQLALNKKMVGTHVKDNFKIIMDLAQTYCLQRKFLAFSDLMQSHDLKYEC